MVTEPLPFSEQHDHATAADLRVLRVEDYIMQHGVVGRKVIQSQTDPCSNFGDLPAATSEKGVLALDRLMRNVGPFLDVVNKGVGLTGGVPVMRSEVTAAAVFEEDGAARFSSLHTASTIEIVVGPIVRLQDAQAIDAVDSTLFGQLTAGALAFSSTGVIQLLHGAHVSSMEKTSMLVFWANVSEHIKCFWNSYRLDDALREAGTARGCLYLGPMPDALRRLFGVVDMPRASLSRAVEAEHDGMMAAFNPPPPRPHPAVVPAGSKRAIALVSAAAHLLPIAVTLPLLRPACTGPVEPYRSPRPGRTLDDLSEGEAQEYNAIKFGRERRSDLGKRQREDYASHAVSAAACQGVQHPAAAGSRSLGLFSGPLRTLAQPAGPARQPAVYATAADAAAPMLASLARADARGSLESEVMAADATWAAPHARAVAEDVCAPVITLAPRTLAPRTLARHPAPARQRVVHATAADAAVQIRARLDRADARALEETRVAEAFWASPCGRAKAVAVCDRMGDDDLADLMKDDVRRLQRASPREVVAGAVLQGAAVRAMNRRLSDVELEAWAERERRESSARRASTAGRESGSRPREPEPNVPVNLVSLVRIRPKVRAAYVYAALRARRRLADQTIIALTGPARIPVAPRALPPVPSGTKIQW